MLALLLSLACSADSVPVDSAVEDPPRLLENTYTMSMAEGTQGEPAGMNVALEEYLDPRNILLEVVAQDDSTFTVRVGRALEEESGVQDTCALTSEFPSADFAGDPEFQVGPTDDEILFFGHEADADLLPVEALEVSGRFSSDDQSISIDRLSYRLDTEPLVPIIFEDEDDPMAVCDFLNGFGVSCEACTDGVETCLYMEMADLTAQRVPEASVEEVTTSCM